MRLEEESPIKSISLVRYGKIEVFEQNGGHFEAPKSKKTPDASQSSTEDILNTILPPLPLKNEKGEQCFQYVLTTPAKASDLYELQTLLDNALQNERARETGICPIRERLYSEFLDELIRQITINCSHRGILLFRIRNELKSEIELYQKLYVSSLAYGIRASIAGNNEEVRLNQGIDDAEREIAQLEKEIADVQHELRTINEVYEEEKEREAAVIDGQVDKLKSEHDGLRGKLKELLTISAK